MATISQKIPNLLGGISQQPDPTKLQGQVNNAVNVMLDPTFGCSKRPPLKFIGELATNIPTDAHWFPILRDENERYVAVAYTNTGVGSVRVWNADTGVEQTVNVQGDALDYVITDSPDSLHELTISDYTLLANSEKKITMSDNSGQPQAAEALLVIGEIGYDTTYAVDFLKSANNQKVKIYRAKKISVSPGSFEVPNDQTCSLASNQDFVEAGNTGQADLGFSLITNCTPTLVTTDVPGIAYPTQVAYSSGNKTTFANNQFGNANSYGSGSYLYSDITKTTTAGDISVRIEYCVGGNNTGSNSYAYTSAVVTSYTTTSSSPEWIQRTIINFNGLNLKISGVQRGPSGQTYSYKSVYESQVRLNSGGTGWRVGDTTQVTMAGKTYTITVEEETFSYGFQAETSISFTTASSGTLNIQDIITGLKTSIDAIGTYTSETIGNVILLRRNDSAEFNLQTRGGTTNRAIVALKSEVSDISQLPAQCINGVVIKIRNTSAATADDYYVKFEATEGEIPGTGTWVETVKPGISTDINNSTMPHSLIREADGTFSFRPLSRAYSDTLFWAGREVGDTKTNPSPTFVGDVIRDMFFYQNRLGFLSSENVILSQAGDYYNFFSGSAIALSDADPIDLTATATKPSSLKKALGTSKGLLLFAENSQFLLATTDVAFGPSTVKLTEISNYAYTSKISPLESGVSIVFSTEADTYSKVFEMAVESIDNRPIVAENTRIIPELIPPNLEIAASSPNNSFLCFGNGTEELFTFKFFNEGNQRSIAGWTRWIMPGDVELFDFAHDTAFAVMYNKTSQSHVLSKFEFLDDPNLAAISIYDRKFVPRLDYYLFKSELTITEISSDTRIRFPSGMYSDANTVYILNASQDSSIDFQEATVLQDGTGFYTDVLTSSLSDQFVIGISYEMLVELPSFFVFDEQRSDRRNVPVVENVNLDIQFSGSLDVHIARTGYDTRAITLEQVPADIYLADAPAISRFSTDPIPVYCQGSQAHLTVRSINPLPVSIASYSWEGFYNNRGIQSLA